MREVIARIGTRDAISWVTIVFFFPMSLVFSLNGSGVSLEGGKAIPFTIASLVSSTIVIGWLLTAKFLIFRHRPADESRPALVLLTFAVALLLRAAVFDQLLIAFGLTESSRVGFRLVTSLLSTGGFLVLIAMVVSTARYHRRTLERINRAQNSFDELSARFALLVDSERTRVVHAARVDIDERLRDLNEAAGTEALTRVRDAIEEVVRPLSQQLSDPRSTSVTVPEAISKPVGWGDPIHRIFASNPWRPLWYTSWVTLASLSFAPGLWGFALGMLFVALVTVATFAISALGWLTWDPLLAPRRWAVRAWAFTATALLIGLAVDLGGNALSETLASRGWMLTVASMVVSLVTAWVFAALVSLHRFNESLGERLRETERHLRYEKVRLNTVLHAEMRALARTLHGPVQDALSAAAFRITAALENEQPSRALLEEVQASIRTSLEQLPASEREAMDSAAMLTQLVEFWDGIATIICAVSDDAHDALAHYTTSRSSFNELIRESCSNAIRHGNADQIEVTVELRGGELVFTVRNNGTPLAADARPGLGSRMLDELSLSWRRAPTEDGTLLTVRLPLVE